MKIHRKTTSATFAIEVKRLYLPFVIVDECPQCGRSITKDLTKDYLSYPDIDGYEPVPMYCYDHHVHEGCEHQWTLRVRLKVQLAAADDDR